MAWTTKVDPIDESFHPKTDDPWWNESSFITFRVPERNLMGMHYHYFRPNQNTLMGGPFIWDDTGADMSTALFTGWDWHMPIPEGADMFDFKADSTFEVRTVEPQQEYRYLYDGLECQYDMVYTAAREPYYQRAANVDKTAQVRDGMADLVADVDADVTTGHYEQYGLMNGTLKIYDEVVELRDAVCIKDRSWGPRKVLVPMEKKRVGYNSCMASKDHAFHMWAISRLPWDEDLLLDTTEIASSGYYVRDGVVGHIVSGTRRCLGRDDDGRPVHDVVEGKDSHGREFHAEGVSTECVLRWPGCYGDYQVFIVQMKYTFDGVEDVPGEVQDYMSFRTYRNFMATHRDRNTSMIP